MPLAPARSLAARTLAMLLFAGMAAGCARNAPPCPPGTANGQPMMPDWHDVITDPDHVRLRDWRAALVEALASARATGHGAEIDAQGKLLDPDTSMDDAALPVGYYRCRVIKLGARRPDGNDFIAYPAHRCQVRPSNNITRLVELDGLQRPSGRIYPDGRARSIFLGTMVLGDEQLPISYGRDGDRDMVGVVQRIGEKRWRMLLPRPAWESTADVMELVPEG